MTEEVGYFLNLRKRKYQVYTRAPKWMHWTLSLLIDRAQNVAFRFHPRGTPFAVPKLILDFKELIKILITNIMFHHSNTPIMQLSKLFH